MKKPIILVIFAAVLLGSNLWADGRTYIIQKGDTLYGISKKNNLSLDELKSANKITDPSKIYPGMEIIIPGGYRVKKGDTFYGIARAHDIRPAELAAMNNMDLNDTIYPGLVLRVPVAASTVAEASGPSGEDGDQPDEASDKNDSKDSPEPSGPLTAAVPERDYFWPHEGDRTKLTGKLMGMQIDGSEGDKVLAVSGGTVVWSSEYGMYKYLVLVESRSGIVYGYGGNEKTIVKVGDWVAPGAVIGILGGSGKGAEAYFFVYKDGKPLDPEKAPRV